MSTLLTSNSLSSPRTYNQPLLSPKLLLPEISVIHSNGTAIAPQPSSLPWSSSTSSSHALFYSSLSLCPLTKGRLIRADSPFGLTNEILHQTNDTAANNHGIAFLALNPQMQVALGFRGCCSGASLLIDTARPYSWMTNPKFQSWNMSDLSTPLPTYPRVHESTRHALPEEKEARRGLSI